MNKFDEEREKANWDILRILMDYLDEYPTQRFGQMLVNLDIIVRPSPLFYEEPQVTLNKIKEQIKLFESVKGKNK